MKQSSVLDKVYARWSGRNPFFRHGWGDREVLIERLSQVEFKATEPIDIEIDWGAERLVGKARIKEGFFRLPLDERFNLPKESLQAHVEMVLPANQESCPVCVLFAATGDQGFSRRRLTMAFPLLRSGIGSVILENPYYGRRRPSDQTGVKINSILDLWNMGFSVVEEGKALVRWLRNAGYGPIGVSGVSMGGQMAAMVGSQIREPIAIVPCVAPHSAAAVFLDGVMSKSYDPRVLHSEFEHEDHSMDFLRSILERCDVRLFPPPFYPQASILVGALHDAYILPDAVLKLHEHWPGSQLRWLNTGHIGAFLFYRDHFQQAILEAFSALGHPSKG